MNWFPFATEKENYAEMPYFGTMLRFFLKYIRWGDMGAVEMDVK